jgi:hypothetical protein
MHRLHRLAETRAIYFAELATSGRWQHYYTREELDANLKETAGLAAYWQQAIGIARAAEGRQSDAAWAVVPPTLVSPAPEAKAPEAPMWPGELRSNVTPLFAKAG